MSTSGSIDYSLNARQLVTWALKKTRIIQEAETPSADQLSDAYDDLNLMLKGWQKDGPNLWRQTFGSATLVTATASYTLSPRPRRVIEARYRDTSGRDIPMTLLTRQEYVDLPLKTSTGIPTQYYIDYQRDSVLLYVWPVPASATTETVQYTYQRYAEDIDAATNDIDIPPEWFETVGYNLADRLLESYGLKDDRISARAMMLLMAAKDDDREDFVRFVVDRR